MIGKLYVGCYTDSPPPYCVRVHPIVMWDANKVPLIAVGSQLRPPPFESWKIVDEYHADAILLWRAACELVWPEDRYTIEVELDRKMILALDAGNKTIRFTKTGPRGYVFALRLDTMGGIVMELPGRSNNKATRVSAVFCASTIVDASACIERALLNPKVGT